MWLGTPSDEARVRGLEFTAQHLTIQIDLLIMALGASRPQQEIQNLCREGPVVIDYAPTPRMGSLTGTVRTYNLESGA